MLNTDAFNRKIFWKNKRIPSKDPVFPSYFSNPIKRNHISQFQVIHPLCNNNIIFSNLMRSVFQLYSRIQLVVFCRKFRLNPWHLDAWIPLSGFFKIALSKYNYLYLLINDRFRNGIKGDCCLLPILKSTIVQIFNAYFSDVGMLFPMSGCYSSFSEGHSFCCCDGRGVRFP